MESGRLMPPFTYVDGNECANDGVIQSIRVKLRSGSKILD